MTSLHEKPLRLNNQNQLYFGDNPQVLREHIADASVDLIYLDPPFNSKRDYNLLFTQGTAVAGMAAHAACPFASGLRPVRGAPSRGAFRSRSRSARSARPR